MNAVRNVVSAPLVVVFFAIRFVQPFITILKAFWVFIAFTNMKTKAQVTALDVQELFKQTKDLFIHDDDNCLKQRFRIKKDS